MKNTPRPKFSEALKFWFKLGWISFGGTTGHIAIMHDFLVEEKGWISDSKFVHALNHCMILPGPEAQQLAIYIGTKLHGKKGGIIAGTFFVLPSMFILLALSIIYVSYGQNPLVLSVFAGLKPAVVAIIAVATYKVGKKALLTPFHFVAAAAAFIGTFFFHLPMLLVLFCTLVTGLALRFIFPDKSVLKAPHSLEIEEHTQNSSSSFQGKILFKQICYFLGLWLAPFALLFYFGTDSGFWKELSLFFTQTAFITIGGSYTVMPYVAQYTVGKLFWLNKLQMVDGFALAETTPGPLIIVLSYVGFMAGYNHFGGSLMMGTIGLLAATYFTFLPNFLFIFAGAPLIEKTQGKHTIEYLLSLVTATVVGVILNLAFYLGKDILFPDGVSFLKIDWMASIWVLFSLTAILKFRLNIFYLVGLSLLYGLVHYWIIFQF